MITNVFTDYVRPYLFNIIIGFMILIVAHYVGVYVYNMILAYAIKQNNLNNEASNLSKIQHTNLAYNVAAQISYYVIIILSFIILLNTFGVETTSIIALFGASSIAIGFAVQGTLNDFFSGILQAINQKINVGDVVEFNGILGRVVEFTLLYTTIQDVRTGAIIKVPNRMFETNIFTNYSLMEKGYANINIAISNSANTVAYEKIFVIIQEAIKQHKGILSDEPTMFVNNMSGGFTNISVKIPIMTKDYPKIQSELSTMIRIALQKNNVGLASCRGELK